MYHSSYFPGTITMIHKNYFHEAVYYRLLIIDDELRFNEQVPFFD